jgi:hypothetical protein
MIFKGNMAPACPSVTEQGRMVLLAIRARAREGQVVLTRLLLQHGVMTLHKMAVFLARAVQMLQREAKKTLLYLSFNVHWTKAQHLLEHVIKKALASIIVFINSNALRTAAKELISFSVSKERVQSQNQTDTLDQPRTAYACTLRLLGGSVW